MTLISCCLRISSRHKDIVTSSQRLINSLYVNSSFCAEYKLESDGGNNVVTFSHLGGITQATRLMLRNTAEEGINLIFSRLGSIMPLEWTGNARFTKARARIFNVSFTGQHITIIVMVCRSFYGSIFDLGLVKSISAILAFDTSGNNRLACNICARLCASYSLNIEQNTTHMGTHFSKSCHALTMSTFHYTIFSSL